MTTDRREALGGGVRPAGLVNVIGPGGGVAGASVLGVTRDGATTCALAGFAATHSAKETDASAPHPRGGRSTNLAAHDVPAPNSRLKLALFETEFDSKRQ